MLNNTGKTHNDPMDCQTYFFDTVVIGGGTAGVAAALNAAQEQRVLILENKYALGGASTLGQVTPRMSTYVNGFKTATQDVHSYSDRKYTESSTMENKVDAETILWRSRDLKQHISNVSPIITIAEDTKGNRSCQG